MKNNKFSDTVKEYVHKINDDDIRFLSIRFAQRIGPDLAEAIELLQRNDELDHWLSQSKCSTDFYDMVDVVDGQVQAEAKRRFVGRQ